ncbi:MAG: DUF4286 family protein [Chitinophagales bacterium]
MLIYSVHITLEQAAETEWLEYMQQKHLNDVMATDCFVSCQMLKQTDFISDNTVEYVIQYSANTMEKLQHYLDEHAMRLRQDVVIHFGSRFSAERRIYEVLKTL